MNANTIKLCRTSLPEDDSGFTPIVQIQYLSQVKNAVNATPYGLHSNPVKETPCLLISINGDSGNNFIIPLSIEERIIPEIELEESEVITGNFTKKSTIFFDADGNINITSSKDTIINVAGNCKINVDGSTDITSTCDVSVDAPNINITADTNITGNTLVTGTLESTSTLTAGNGATGSFDIVTVVDGIVTAGS